MASAPRVGSLSTKTYQNDLSRHLRDGAISHRLHDALEASDNIDHYTRVVANTLLCLNDNYDVGLADIESESLAKVFAARHEVRKESKRENSLPADEAVRERSFLEVDHVWDVQLWAKAIEIVNRRKPAESAGGERFTISFAQTLFLYSFINDTSNLNVTPWSVNSVAKNKLITRFLTKYDFLAEAVGAPTWAYNSLMATDMPPKSRAILQVVTSSGRSIGVEIGRRMIGVLDTSITPTLRDIAEGADGVVWSSQERLYFGDLLMVLRDMCARLWHEVRTSIEKEEDR